MQQKSSFLRGAFILAAAGIVSKIIGAFYRIPLTNIIGPEGMGLYQIAYPVYAFLLVISTAGIPTAISKMVSEKLATNDKNSAYGIFKVSLKLLLIIGIITTVVMAFGSRIFAKAAGNVNADYSFLAISPALFIVSALSSYRGFYQGMQYMEVTAVSQLIEQAGKLLIGFQLAISWKAAGIKYGAAGALLGVSLSELAALVFVIGVNDRKIKKDQSIKKNKISNKSFREISVKLLKIAVPVTIGASIMPLISFLDTAIVINRLESFGMSTGRATAYFGDLTAIVNPLINMPAVLTLALAMSLVPSISESKAVNDNKMVMRKSLLGFKIALLIGVPAAAGFFILNKQIISLLYPSLSGEHMKISCSILMIMSAAVLFLSLVQSMTGILQGLGKPFIPVKNLVIGALLKIIITYYLIGVPSIGILGAPIGTVVCYMTAGILNSAAVFRESGIRKCLPVIFKICVSTSVMAVFIFIINNRIEVYSSAKTVLIILAAVLIYCIMIVITRVIDINEIEGISHNEKVKRILTKIYNKGYNYRTR